MNVIWEEIVREKYKTYKNKSMDLMVDVYEQEDVIKAFVNYKGYNIAVPMMFWEFPSFVSLHSIEVDTEGKDKETCFVVAKEKQSIFLDDIFFFLSDNNMDSVLREEYRLTV